MAERENVVSDEGRLTCEQNVYARHLYLLVHHAQAAGNCAEAP